MTQTTEVKAKKLTAATPKKAEGEKVEKEPHSPPSPLQEPPENLPEIHVDPELRDLLPRLPEGVYATLEKKLLKQKGGAQVIVNPDGVILDGHHGYEISIKHGLPFSTRVLDLKSKKEEKLWMKENQLARRNLTKFQGIEYALQLEDEIAAQAKANQKAAGGTVPEKSPKPIDVREEVAKLADTSSNTVSKVKYILEHADDATKEKLRRDEPGTSINKVYNEIKAEKKPKTSGNEGDNPKSGGGQPVARKSKKNDDSANDDRVQALLTRVREGHESFSEDERDLLEEGLYNFLCKVKYIESEVDESDDVGMEEESEEEIEEEVDEDDFDDSDMLEDGEEAEQED